MRETKLPIFLRGAYWYCHVRTPDGRRPQRALHIRYDGSDASYRAAVAAYWQEQSRATAGTDDRERRARKPLGKALEALTAEQELAGLTAHSLDNTLYRGRRLLEHFTSAGDLTAITTEEMVAYAAEARKTRAAGTVRMELEVLRQAARAVGVTLPRRPKLKPETKRQEPLTREQLRLFFVALHPRQRLLGLALITLGCRASEVGKIPETGIDWNARTLWIHGTKTERSRRQLPIPAELFAHMKELREAGKWRGFPKSSRQAVDQVVRAACLRAFGEARSVNDLRGAWATHAALEGVPADVRAAYQGNSPAMQATTYAQPGLMVEELRGAVERGIPRVRSCTVSASTDTPIAADTTQREPATVTKLLGK